MPKKFILGQGKFDNIESFHFDNVQSFSGVKVQKDLFISFDFHFGFTFALSLMFCHSYVV